MDIIMDLCFLCTKDYDCIPIHEKIVSQVEYLLPEITIIKLGVPLRICSDCDGALCDFNKFKQCSVESSRRLEASIKGAQGPPLHTDSPPVVDNNETSSAKFEKIEEIFIKEEYVEETPLDTQMHTDSAEPQNQLHIDRVSQNIQLHSDTNADNVEQIFIKEEQMEETLNDDTDRLPEHNTEDESATFNTSGEILAGRSIDFKNEYVQETDGYCSKNIQNQTTIKKEQMEDTPQGTFYFNKIFKEECVSNSTNDDTDSQLEHNKVDETSNTSEEIWEGSSADFKEETDGNYSKNIQTDAMNITGDYQCKVCNQLFARKYHFNRHMKYHAGKKGYQCDVCNKSFTHKNNLNVHMEIHPGMKNFQCGVCNKPFTCKTNLNKHMKIHSRVKGFQCGVCNKFYTQKTYFNKHMEKHSRMKVF